MVEPAVGCLFQLVRTARKWHPRMHPGAAYEIVHIPKTGEPKHVATLETEDGVVRLQQAPKETICRKCRTPMDSKLSSKQQVQEDEYSIPYHWYKSPDTYDGRLYFGYLNRCIALAHTYMKGDVTTNSIIDVGCGDGRLLGLLRDGGFTKISGIDYSRRATAFAKLLVPEANVSCVDLTTMAKESGTYDVAFLIETLEHIVPSEIGNVLATISTILKPKGLLVVTVPSLYGGAPSAENKHYQHFTQESLREVLAPQFTVLHLEGQDRMGFHWFKLIYKIIHNRLWDIVPLRELYNLVVWPQIFNTCKPTEGRRLVAVCQKVK